MSHSCKNCPNKGKHVCENEESGKLVKIVGIRFKQAGKIYYFDPKDLTLAVGDFVIVETARGLEFGKVVIAEREVPASQINNPLKEVLRKATEADIQKHEANNAAEKEAFKICQAKIAQHGLPIKLIEVSYTADGRIDFRELVKDLAAIFRTRIELRQIGVRDEAKALGGLGTCGRVLCCHSVLGDFQPVSIRMAKKQNLSLNPAKISGICGRLMCCLKFEEGNDDMPKTKFQPLEIPVEEEDEEDLKRLLEDE